MARGTLTTHHTPEAPAERFATTGRQEGQTFEPGKPSRLKRNWLAPLLLLGALAATGTGLVFWKINAIQHSQAAAANQPEYVESITVASATAQQHRRTTTAIGTVMALRSITLRNEMPGTVREVRLTPGKVVEAGTLLVAQDVSVEEAELQALAAETALAETQLDRMERAVQSQATSVMEVDRARADRDIGRAQMARLEAIIARKTIRAPFRARIGISDVHPGQYLNQGTELTTLQGVDEAAHVDFTIPQQVALGLKAGDTVEVLAGPSQTAVPAEITALDSRVDATTRSITVRAKVADAQSVPAPGASVRVRVPSGQALSGFRVPVSAVRKGPAGDHVFVIAPDPQGTPRAQLRQVQIGSVLGDSVLVLAGLSDGEKVAAQGSFKLREGVAVAVASNPLAATPTDGNNLPK